MPTSRFTLLALAVLLPGCRPSAVSRPASTETHAYVLRLGNDTVAVDQYTIARDRIEGTLVTHLPRAIVTRYVVTVDPASGMPASLEYNTRLPDGSLVPAGGQPGIRSVAVSYGRDSAHSRVQRDTMIVGRVAARNTVPYINYSMAFFQIPITALRAANQDSASYAIYTSGRVTTPMTVARSGANAYTVRIGGYPYAVTTDERGLVETVDGALTTQHFLARRQWPLDIAALATAWAASQRNARPATSLSLRDTTRATFGSAELWVDYGRPSARGRRVWGPNGVLNDTLWRTGANAATQLRTNVPLTIGGQSVPPGMYTLWTIAVPGRYQLIINKQTGQWGTVYDPRQDLVRVPLQSQTLSAPVEQFTILLTPTGPNAGVLRLQWDTMELSVPFTTQ